MQAALSCGQRPAEQLLLECLELLISFISLLLEGFGVSFLFNF